MTTVPAILLQEPSPNRPPSGHYQPQQHLHQYHQPTRDRSSNGSSHSQQQHQVAQGPLSIETSAPPSPSPLAVPQVPDAELQRFFNDIALQFSSIQAGGRSSIISNNQPASPTESFASPVFPSISPNSSGYAGRALPSPTSPGQMVFAPFRPINAANAPPSTPATPAFSSGGTPDQFEDAEDDQSDVGSIHSSIRHPYDSHRQPRTPLSPGGGSWLDQPSQQDPIGLGIASFSPNLGPRSRETLRPPNSPAGRNNRWSTASGSSTTSSQYQQQQQHPQQQHARQQEYRTASGGSYTSDGTNKENGHYQHSPGQQHDSRSSRGSASSAYSAPPNTSSAQYYGSNNNQQGRPSYDRTPTKNSVLSVPVSAGGGRLEAGAYAGQTAGQRTPLGEAKPVNGMANSQAGERRSAPGALPPILDESKGLKKGRKRAFYLSLSRSFLLVFRAQR
jgi:hypothetical protein